MGHRDGLYKAKKNRRTAKLTPFATKTMELTALVPLPQGNTHFPDAPFPRQDEPGPRTGSYPAWVASPWKSVKE